MKVNVTLRRTALRRDARISKALAFSETGGVWVKDETSQLGGSHKARHLLGILNALEESSAPLAIASCGNAALAAALLAEAARRELHVFVPEGANDAIVAELLLRGARVEVCARRRDVPGDPSVRAFRDAVKRGAVPFTVQGTDQPLAIEGGVSIGSEVLESMTGRGVAPEHWFTQVGGGALAAACARAARRARESGQIRRLPKLHAVQTEGCHPFERAHRFILERRARGESVDAVLGYAAAHSGEFMRPWETTPRSLATGILDDETYDWVEVERGLLESGGEAIVVSEKEIMESNDLANDAQRVLGLLPVSFTGSAGLAGLLQWRRAGAVARDDNAVVLFTGVARAGGG